MAKLNGVNVLSAMIQYNGVQYAKSESPASQGDIVQVTHAHGPHFTKDAFYAVTKATESGNVCVVDNVGDETAFRSSRYDVFKPSAVVKTPKKGDRIRSKATGKEYTLGDRAPHLDGPHHGTAYYVTEGTWLGVNQFDVIESAPSVESATDEVVHKGVRYRKVARKAAPGQLIVVTDWKSSKHIYHDVKVGEVLTTKVVHDDGDVIRVVERSIDAVIGYDNGEYAVLVPIKPVTETVSDEIVHNGVRYRKVARLAKSGDLAVVIGNTTKFCSHGYDNGTVIKATGSVSDRGNVYFEAVSGRLSQYVGVDDYRVLEPIKTIFKIGDTVKIQAGDAAGKFPLLSTENGDLCTVVNLTPSHVCPGVIGLKRKSDDGRCYARPDQIVKVDPQVDAKVVEQPSFRVGDRVKLVVMGRPNHGWGQVKNGDIGTVKSVSGNDLYVDFPAQSRWHGLASEFVLAEPKTAVVGDHIRITGTEVTSRERGSHDFKIGQIVKVTAVFDSSVRAKSESGISWVVSTADYRVVDAPIEPKSTFAVGDYARVKTGAIGLISEYIGKIVKVAAVYGGSGYAVSTTAGKVIGSAYPSELEPVTAADAKAAAKVGDFRKGDLAKLKDTVGALSGFKTGDIVEIMGVDVGYYKLEVKNVGNGTIGYTDAKSLEKIDQATADAVAVAARWSAIGRKVGEFKKGDVVMFNGCDYCHGMRDVKSVITTVDRVGSGDLNVHIVKTIESGYDTWTKPQDLTLLTPVEQRFDK